MLAGVADAVGLRVDPDGFLVAAFPAEPTPERLASTSARAGMPMRAEVYDAFGFDELVRAGRLAAEAALAPEVATILDEALAIGASDVHLMVGSAPIYRVGGVLRPAKGIAELSAPDMHAVATYVAPGVVGEAWDGDCDSAISYRGARMRVSLFRQRPSVVLRIIPGVVPAYETLGAPEVLTELIGRRQGLLIFAGPTGSGKSTTMASLIDRLNTTTARNIVTIEDPIEYLHGNKRSIVRQREVGDDTASFAKALRAALRQDPDVILVGEMRDLETIETTLIAAETGHLVLSTVHASDSRSVIERIVDVFPVGGQAQIRTQLAATLLAAVTQSLVESAEHPGQRHLAVEVLVTNSAVRSHIRSGETHQIPNDIATGGDDRMTSMDRSLVGLVAAGKITLDEGRALARDPKHFEDLRRGVSPAGAATVAGDGTGPRWRAGGYR
jgi:twitching motility protein PilT